MQDTYNGWTNHATWEMYCYLTSEYTVYKLLVDVVRDSGADGFKAGRFCQDAARSAGWPITHNGVNWLEIGDAFVEDAIG